MEQKRELLLVAMIRADFGGVVTENSASVSVETSDSRRLGNDSKPVISTKRLKLIDEFEDDDSDSDSSQRLHNILSSNEKPSDVERADPLICWKKNSKYRQP